MAIKDKAVAVSPDYMDVLNMGPSETIRFNSLELADFQAMDFDSAAAMLSQSLGMDIEEAGEPTLKMEDIASRDILFIAWKFLKSQYGGMFAVADVLVKGDSRKGLLQVSGPLICGSGVARKLEEITRGRMAHNRLHPEAPKFVNAGLYGRIELGTFTYAATRDASGNLEPLRDADGKVVPFDAAVHEVSGTADVAYLNAR